MREYQLGGKRYVEVPPERPSRDRFIWFVAWGFSLVDMVIRERWHVPDDIQ